MTLSFRFKFLSEEFPEFVGSEFNDAFIAEVGHAPTWITVNGAGIAKVSRAAARGTTYDAATGKLRASTPVEPGYRLLYLSLFDQGDRQYDSAVFIDRLLVRHSSHRESGLAGSR